MTNYKPYILITGASSGVGRATAVLLSSEYNLVIHGRNTEKLEQTKSLCADGCDVKLWLCDFTSINDVEESLMRFLMDNDIQISGYVHSSGMAAVLPLRASLLDQLTTIFNVNFFSASVISKLLVQKKINGAELRNIIFISSNISNRGGKGFSSYAASKGALDAFMRCLAVELAPKVRVNSILPGGMRTDMTDQMLVDEEVLNRMEATYPLGMGSPEDIAHTVRFLLSDDAKWITGQQLTIDGGRTIDITG